MSERDSRVEVMSPFAWFLSLRKTIMRGHALLFNLTTLLSDELHKELFIFYLKKKKKIASRVQEPDLK